MEEKYVRRAWTNYSQPSALKALSGFVKARGIKDKKGAEKTLSKIHAFSVHKPARQKYPTRSIILKDRREHFCADLIDFQAYSRQNSGYHWLLIVLDGFTKEMFAHPLKKKTAQEVSDAFDKIIKQAKKPPVYCFTDAGLEFRGSAFQDLMKRYNITHYVSQTKRKAFMCERAIRTIKTLLYKYFTQENTKRWLDILPKILATYNNSVHSSHGFRPSAIKAKDSDEIFHRLYAKMAQKARPVQKFGIGEKVRIAKSRLTFTKGYEQSFSDEVYRVVSYVPGSYPVHSYKLETLDGTPISSSFVEAELGYADQDA